MRTKKAAEQVAQKGSAASMLGGLWNLVIHENPWQCNLVLWLFFEQEVQLHEPLSPPPTWIVLWWWGRWHQRKLLGDTSSSAMLQGGLPWCWGNGWPGTSSTAQVKADHCPRNRIILWNKGVWAPTSRAAVLQTGNPSITSASGGLLWQRVCGLWKRRGAPLERSW